MAIRLGVIADDFTAAADIAIFLTTAEAVDACRHSGFIAENPFLSSAEGGIPITAKRALAP